MAAPRRLPLLFRRNQATMGESREPVARSLRQTIDARVLDHFVPPHVAVTRAGDVVYFSQRTGKFLEPPPGRPSRSLMAMARKGLRLPLRAALHEAVEKGHRVIKDNIPVEGDEHTEHVRILVEPMRDNGQESLYLVVFNEVRPPPPREPEPKGKRRKAAPPDPNIERLDRELRETRERLQSMMEEYETAIEELKSSNEEMVSVNEELQSTNEELETSKEELQSVNEELQTVNNELTLKIEELDGANSDLRNLYESTDIAAIFLDREIRIRSFTPAVTRIFNLIQSDRGRPLTDIAHRLDYGDLHRDIQGVLENQQATERRTGVKDGSAHYIVRVLPYRGGNGQFAGAVLTFHDVTSLS